MTMLICIVIEFTKNVITNVLILFESKMNLKIHLDSVLYLLWKGFKMSDGFVLFEFWSQKSPNIWISHGKP